MAELNMIVLAQLRLALNLRLMRALVQRTRVVGGVAIRFDGRVVADFGVDDMADYRLVITRNVDQTNAAIFLRDNQDHLLLTAFPANEGFIDLGVTG